MAPSTWNALPGHSQYEKLQRNHINQGMLLPDLLCLIFRSRGANDASRVRVQLSSSRVVNIELDSSLLEPSSTRLVNISSRARARVELTRVEF